MPDYTLDDRRAGPQGTNGIRRSKARSCRPRGTSYSRLLALSVSHVAGACNLEPWLFRKLCALSYSEASVFSPTAFGTSLTGRTADSSSSDDPSCAMFYLAAGIFLIIEALRDVEQEAGSAHRSLMLGGLRCSSSSMSDRVR